MISSLEKNLKLEYQRYADSTLIITLFSEILKENNSLGKLKYIEKELKLINKELESKLNSLSIQEILQNHKSDLKGLKKIEVDLVIESNDFEIVEFKTSVSENINETENTIKQILERDSNLLNDLEVLKTKSIIFLCHKDDSQRILNELEKHKSKLNRKVIVLEWIQGDNKEKKSCIYLCYKEGDFSSSPLSEELKKSDICRLAPDLCWLRQKKNFDMTGKKPPKQYLLSIFKKFLVEKLHDILNAPYVPDEYTLPEDKDFLKESFIERFKNEFSKPQKNWFEECLQEFQNLKILKIDSQKITLSIKELTKKRKPSEWEFFSSFCAKKFQRDLEKKEKNEKKLEMKKIALQSQSKSADLSTWI
jgi:hypothetical protein